MVFLPPSWVPPLLAPPDDVTIADFIRDEKYGRLPLVESRDPFICGITGRSFTAAQVKERVDHLSRSIRHLLGFNLTEETEWDRVVAIYSLNAIDYIPIIHSVHRLLGIVTPASASHSVAELVHQLRSSGAKAIFTCIPLLKTALAAAREVGISEGCVFIIPLPNETQKIPFKSVDDLVALGKTLPPVEAPRWVAGQGVRTTAFLSYSSGTSGLPKAVKISHHNVISNVLQLATFESVERQKLGIQSQVALGVLPFSHIYGLVTISHLANYRGDAIIVLPRFELRTLLASIQRFRIEQMSIVPPILIQMLANRELCSKFDLSSVRFAFTGAAPLGSETAKSIMEQYPNWKLGQGYGLTEASPSVLHTSESDILPGSSGSLLPGTKAKIIDLQGHEVTEYDKPGELLVQSPSVTLGYLNNEKANAETFQWHHDGLWLRTGDEVVMRKSPFGNEHGIIVDRIKELIKVKGHQVAPAELEAHLLDHPLVADCAVIGILDDRAGEVPKAFIVKDQAANDKSDEDLALVLREHVEKHKARHKWLKGGIDFVDSIPKSPSGKILRRVLRDAPPKGGRGAKAKL